MLTESLVKSKINKSRKRYYVYGLFEPKSNKPFYIGKGSGYRVLEHLELKCGNKAKKDIIRKHNKDIRYKIYYFTDNESKAYGKESRLIYKYLNTLTNKANPIYADKKSVTKEILLKRAIKLHPRLDYSDTVYRGWDVPIQVRCSIHGLFKTTCRNHLKQNRPTGCPECGSISSSHKNSIKGRGKFKKFIKEHRHLYSFKFFKYVNARVPGLIYCKKEGHGFFKKSADSIMGKEVCPKCSKTISGGDTFEARAVARHGHVYDYSKVTYLNNKTKVKVICQNHGLFEVTPDNHINKGSGCPKCGRLKASKSRAKTYAQRVEV